MPAIVRRRPPVRCVLRHAGRRKKGVTGGRTPPDVPTRSVRTQIRGNPWPASHDTHPTTTAGHTMPLQTASVLQQNPLKHGIMFSASGLPMLRAGSPHGVHAARDGAQGSLPGTAAGLQSRITRQRRTGAVRLTDRSRPASAWLHRQPGVLPGRRPRPAGHGRSLASPLFTPYRGRRSGPHSRLRSSPGSPPACGRATCFGPPGAPGTSASRPQPIRKPGSLPYRPSSLRLAARPPAGAPGLHRPRHTIHGAVPRQRPALTHQETA